MKLFLNQVAETNKIPLSFDWSDGEYKPNKTTRKAIEASLHGDIQHHATYEDMVKSLQTEKD